MPTPLIVDSARSWTCYGQKATQVLWQDQKKKPKLYRVSGHQLQQALFGKYIKIRSTPEARNTDR